MSERSAERIGHVGRHRLHDGNEQSKDKVRGVIEGDQKHRQAAPRQQGILVGDSPKKGHSKARPKKPQKKRAKSPPLERHWRARG
jgi:hypothetical protein